MNRWRRPRPARGPTATGSSPAASDNLPIHFAFYSDGIYTIETDDPAVLAAHLDQDAEVYAVANRRLVDDLSDEIQQRLVVLDTTRLNRKDVLLVANRPPGK